MKVQTSLIPIFTPCTKLTYWHMVYDTFHTICLNIVKNQIERPMDLEILDQSYLHKQIKSFPWTKELNDGPNPRATKQYKGLGPWKVEGLQKFSFPMADCVLSHCIDNWIESEMHFYSSRNGLTNEMIELHKKLAWRLNIQVEDVQGLQMCTISLHNLIHLHEDIVKFSSSDNYCMVCCVRENLY